MQVRPYTECNHATIVEWWESHGVAPIPHAALPKEGCIAYNDDDDMVAACWIYLDNSAPVAFMSWMIVAPHARVQDKFAGLNHCVQFLTIRCGKLGYGTIIACSAIPSISKLMKPHGFEIVSTGVEVLLKG